MNKRLKYAALAVAVMLVLPFVGLAADLTPASSAGPPGVSAVVDVEQTFDATIDLRVVVAEVRDTLTDSLVYCASHDRSQPELRLKYLEMRGFNGYLLRPPLLI